MHRIREINDFLRREKLLLPRRAAQQQQNSADAHDSSMEDSDGFLQASDDASQASDDASQPDYAVEQVLDERWVGGQRQYLLQWVGDDVPTWEPASNVDNCDGLLAEFNEDLDPGVDEDIGSD